MLYTEEAIRRRKNKEAAIKKCIRITIYSILIPLLMYNISLIFQAIHNPNETPDVFGIKTYVIISGSMEPHYSVGDIVIVKDKYDTLQKGDVISFRRGQAVITHRIVDITVEDDVLRYTTKGDSNNVEDTGEITEDKVEGKVVGKIPALGKLILILKNKAVIVTIVGVYYIYLLREQAIRRKKYRRKEKRIEYENNKKGE